VHSMRQLAGASPQAWEPPARPLRAYKPEWVMRVWSQTSLPALDRVQVCGHRMGTPGAPASHREARPRITAVGPPAEAPLSDREFCAVSQDFRPAWVASEERHPSRGSRRNRKARLSDEVAASRGELETNSGGGAPEQPPTACSMREFFQKCRARNGLQARPNEKEATDRSELEFNDELESPTSSMREFLKMHRTLNGSRSTVRWQWRQESGWKDFDSNASAELEEAYLSDSDTCCFRIQGLCHEFNLRLMRFMPENCSIRRVVQVPRLDMHAVQRPCGLLPASPSSFVPPGSTEEACCQTQGAPPHSAERKSVRWADHVGLALVCEDLTQPGSGTRVWN